MVGEFTVIDTRPWVGEATPSLIGGGSSNEKSI